MAERLAVAGFIVTLTGASSVIAALADLVPSATLVAVTVTACCAVILAGAVYSPVLLTVPTLGFTLQVTAVLPEPPVTVAVNCCVWPAARVAVAGLRETFTGASRVTAALAVLVASATLVAVTVMVCCAVMLAGAVYKPVLLTAPILALQVTAVLPEPPVTVAVNCCV